MQITIEDLSPVEKRVEFELPWADVLPKLDKAYDALRRGVRLPGFRPGKVPRALLEKMYSRQVEDEVARDLVEFSLGQAIRENQIQPVAPPTVDELEIKSGAPFKFSARVEVRSQVTPKDYTGMPVSRRPAKVTDEAIAEALEGYRKRLTEYKPVEGRGRRPATPTCVLVELSGKVGDHKLKRRQVGDRSRDDDAEGPLPGLRQPAARQGHRRRTSRSTTRSPTEGVPAEMAGRAGAPARDDQGGAREEGARRWTTSWPRTPARPRRSTSLRDQGARAACWRPTSSASSAR